MLNEAVREDIKNSVLCWLATVDEDGQPNVSPKEMFCAHDNETIVIAEIASPNSVRNIAKNSKVCLSFVDVFRQRGFKLKGKANFLLPDHAEFNSKGAKLFSMASSDYKIRGIFSIRVEKVERIWAPSYALFPERSEQEHITRTQKTYGVVSVKNLS